MVSTALFAIIALGLATLQGESIKNSVRSNNQGNLAQEIAVFSQALEVVLGNTTRIVSCGCAQNCRFLPETTESDQMNCVSSSSSCLSITPLIEFTSEDANDPGISTYAGCNATTYTGTARGCKKTYRLNLIRPTPIDTSSSPLQVGSPGRLQLVQTATNQTVAELTGVYYVKCGRQPLDNAVGADPRLAPDKFSLELKVKSRADNQNFGNVLSRLEGWYPPLDGNPPDQNFWSGIHREVSTSIPLRNMNTYGVHFGRTRIEFQPVN